jgi:hypothetical protein
VDWVGVRGTQTSCCRKPVLVGHKGGKFGSEDWTEISLTVRPSCAGRQNSRLS